MNATTSRALGAARKSLRCDGPRFCAPTSQCHGCTALALVNAELVRLPAAPPDARRIAEDVFRADLLRESKRDNVEKLIAYGLLRLVEELEELRETIEPLAALIDLAELEANNDSLPRAQLVET